MAILLVGGCHEAFGQLPCATALLQRLSHAVGVPPGLSDGFHYNVLQFNQRPVNVAVQNGEVTHIGYSLFTPSQRAHISPDQCDFIERLLLTSDIDEFYGKSFSRHLLEEKITFEKGSVAELKALCGDTSYVFQMTLQDSKRYICNWYQGRRREVTLSYPADYFLIKGTTLTESEERLEMEARRWRGSAERRKRTEHLEENRKSSEERQPEVYAATELMQQIGNGPVYLLTGDIYLIPELTSNRYWVKDPDSGMQLLYGADLPLESMANLVTGTELETDIDLEILHVLYGFKTATFTLPLRQWVSYCMAQGCQPYFGVMSHEGDTVNASLVLHNEALGYIHLMKLTFDTSAIASRKGVVKARLNSFVPMSNVKSLFNENNR